MVLSKFRFFSDIHLEFILPIMVPSLLKKITPNKKDTVMLCGDMVTHIRIIIGYL